MTNLRSLPLRVLASTLFAAVSVSALVTAQQAAQQVRPEVRIAGPIDESQLVTLKGNVHPAATAKNDRGPVSPDFSLPDLTLVLSRSPEQQAAFDAYVKSQYDSNSPNYHRWLTPAQIGAQFGPNTADIGTITNWLAGHGFAIKSVAPDGMTIRFGGTAAQVESAFHTEIHNLSVNGVPHYANMSDPQIPAALAPVVLGVKALHNFLPRPQHKLGSIVQFNKQAGKWQRVVNSAAATSRSAGSALGQLSASSKQALSPRPLFGVNGTSDGSAYLEEDVTPYDFATIYNVLPLWNNSITGTGQTIAIAGTSFINVGKNGGANDVATYRSAFGLPAGLTPNEIDTGGGPAATICTSTTAPCNEGDLEENSLDVEVSGAVATGAQIDLVVTGQNAQGTIDTVYDSASYIVQNLTAKIMSLSYGECELGQGTAENVAYYDLWQSAAAEGISVFVSTGDSGAPSCDDDLDESYGNPYVAQYGLSVNGIGSTPYNTAVGGTDFSWCQPYYTLSGNNINYEGCATSSTSQGSPEYWSTSNNSTTGASAAGYVPEIPWNDTCENPINARFVETLLNATGVDSYFGVSASTPEETCSLLYNGWEQIDEFFDEEYGFNPSLETFVDTIGGSGGASGCVVNTTDSDTLGACSAGSTSTGATTNPDTGDSQSSITLSNNGWPKPSWQTGVSGIPSDGVRDLPDVSFFAGNGAFDSATLICVSNSGSCAYNGTTENTAQEIGGTSVASPEMAGVMALINQNAGGAQGLPNQQLYELAAKQTYSECSAETVTNSGSCYFQDIDNGPTAPSGPAYTTAQTIAMPCDLDNAPEGGDGGEPFVGTTSPNCAAINSGDTIGTLVSSGTTPAYNSVTGFDLATGLGSMNVANVVNAWPVVVGTDSATVTVTPASNTLQSNQTLNVAITVSGANGTPTGKVTLTAGSYTSKATSLSNGSASITIPVNTFTSSGSVTLTANYSGDAVYASASGSFTIAVTYIAPPTFAVAAPTPTAISSPGGSTTATVTVSTTTGYAGTVAVTCQLQSAVGAAYPPTCAPSGSGTVTLSSGTTSGTVAFTVGTTAATSELVYPRMGKGKGWMGAGGGAVLAFLVFLGVPARRRSWRALLGVLVMMAALGSLSACGGGGGGGGGGTTGTAAGTYTFTITGTGNPAVSPAPSSTFSVTVN